jgi:transcription-repair coupling factor (superfamily II helicase)
VAERLALYQEMDNLKDEQELSAFVQRLIDRFGPIPKEVNELIHSFKLRWLAQDMGIERLVIKSNKLVGYFISNPQSKFFETDLFQNVLTNILKLNGAKLVEQNDKLRLVVENVKHIKMANEIFERLMD